MIYRCSPLRPGSDYDATTFAAHPLTAPQVAALAAKVGEQYPVYELLVLFMAYTGLRAAEVQGLEVRDVTSTTGPDGSVRGSIRVQRTKTRRKREWVIGTPKSKTSKCTVPLPSWLATRIAAYLEETHPHADDPTAVLWPRRLQGNQSRKPVLDWSAPLDLNGFQSKRMIPALEAGWVTRQPARAHRRGRHDVTRHERCSAARLKAHGGDVVAVEWCSLHAGCEVARPFQLRADAHHLRRLRTRSRGRESVTRTCRRRGRDERNQLVRRLGAHVDGGPRVLSNLSNSLTIDGYPAKRPVPQSPSPLSNLCQRATSPPHTVPI
jgi:hypothetical protein